MGLFLAERHEALTAAPWSEDRARDAIARIVADSEAAYSLEGLWPIHPYDVSPERPPDCMKPLYNGAAGTVWALRDLERRGFANLGHDYLPAVRTLSDRHRADIARNDRQRAYLENDIGTFAFTDWGMDLLHWTVAPSAALEQTLQEQIEGRIGNNRGIVWGGAASMLAALFLHERTGDQRWRDLYVRHFDALWEQWDYVQGTGCHLWTVDLYGSVQKRMTALHGFFANAAAMLRGRHLLTAGRESEMLQRMAQTVRATARIDDQHANWPVSTESATDPKAWYLQYCNGAPGALVTLGGSPDDTLDDLFLKGADLIWHAGPPVKLPCLCHGAPAGGYAMLKVYARNGDLVWLGRARRFAMHGIEQADAAAARYGQRKFSLWTGDLGLALFLAACITGDARFPTLDYF